MRICFVPVNTTFRSTSVFLQHLVHEYTAAVCLSTPVRFALCSFAPAARSYFFTSNRQLISTQPLMPQTRSQSKQCARLLEPRSNSPFTTPSDVSASAEPNEFNSLSPSPHGSHNTPSELFAVSDPQLKVPASLSTHGNTSHAVRKRKRHSPDKHTALTVQKRSHIHDHRKSSDIEDAPNPPSPDSARRILHLLQSFYDKPLSTATHPKTKPRKALLDSLIATILSQATSNINSSRAFKKLISRFTSWESALEAGPEEIEACIACGGLAQAKSRVIHDILSRLKTEHKMCSLEFIRDLPSDEVKKVLCSFKGVGPKTASCVLMFAMDRPEFPVDTHVRRIAGRLGWMPPSSTPEKTYERLNSCLPDDAKHDLHVLLVEHGRKTCKASSPLCQKCPLVELCPFSKK